MTGTAAAIAAILLVLAARKTSLTVLLGAYATISLGKLFAPEYNLPWVYVATETALGFFGAAVGLEASMRSRHWNPQHAERLFQTMALVVSAGGLARLSDLLVPMTLPDSIYRFTAFGDLAVAAVLLSARTEDEIDSVACTWIGVCFAITALRLLMFEGPARLGYFFGWLGAAVWVFACLQIATLAHETASRPGARLP